MNNLSLLQELQHQIDSKIIPAKNMQFKILSYNGNTLRVSAPLSANANHHGTAFGGSLYSAAAVAGWALLRCKLAESELSGTIVVSKACMQYKAPVSDDILISARLLNPENITASLRYFVEHKKAKIEVLGIIEQDGTEAAKYEGSYSIKDLN